MIDQNATETEYLDNLYVDDYLTADLIPENIFEHRPVKTNKHYNKQLTHPRLTKEQRFIKKQQTLRAANGLYYVWAWQPIKGTNRQRRVYLSKRITKPGYWWSTHIEDSLFVQEMWQAVSLAKANNGTYEQLHIQEKVVCAYR